MTSAGAGVAYVDTSALIKLIAPEPESAACAAVLRSCGRLVASALLEVEAGRVALRLGAPAPQRVATALEAFTLVPIDREVRQRAAALLPPALRSLDAIHLATAIALGSDLDVLVTYDLRLAEAATAARLATAAPT